MGPEASATRLVVQRGIWSRNGALEFCPFKLDSSQHLKSEILLHLIHCKWNRAGSNLLTGDSSNQATWPTSFVRLTAIRDSPVPILFSPLLSSSLILLCAFAGTFFFF